MHRVHSDQSLEGWFDSNWTTCPLMRRLHDVCITLLFSCVMEY